MLGFSAARRDQEAAERLYAACMSGARDPTFFLHYGVPDTLQGRFEMLTLHLFPVLHRLMHNPGEDPGLARRVAECLVADMDAAFREMGVGDVTVPKKMKSLYRSFAGRIEAYTAAIAAGDAAMRDAISRNVFPDAPVDGHGDALARHVAAAVAAVRAAELAALRRGEVPFAKPKGALATEGLA